jgi:integrase
MRPPRRFAATWKPPAFPNETDAGVADFHSLRASYVSAVVRSGANVKTLQTLARHAKPETTLKHYAKLRGAVESIPCPPPAARVMEALNATPILQT